MALLVDSENQTPNSGSLDTKTRESKDSQPNLELRFLHNDFQSVPPLQKLKVVSLEMSPHVTPESPQNQPDDTKMIFFINPNKEGLLLVVEDTTSGGPITAGIGSLEETVTFFEEEMILNKLSLNFFGHSLKRVIGSSKFIIGKLFKDALNLLFHISVIGFSKAGIEGISLKRATTTNTGGIDELSFRIKIREEMSFAFTEIGSGLFLRWTKTIVVFLNDGIKEGLEEGVCFSIGSINTNTRIKIGDTGLNDIQESCTKFGLLILELIDNFLAQMLLEEGFTILGSLKNECD